MINKRDIIKRKAIRCLTFLFVCMLCIPMVGMKAEAGTTCKSKISYPGSTTAKVNFRQKAGTNYKTYGMLKKGQSVTILGWCTNNGMKWYKCKAKINGKNKTGYISSSYVKQKSKPTGYTNKKVETTLNVRKSAKTSSKVLMKIPAGTKVTVHGIKYAQKKYWYKVKVTYNNKTQTGYVDSAYIDVKNSTTNSGDSSNSTNPTNPINPTPSQPTLTGYVNEKVTSTLNVRNKANVQSTILVSIPRNTQVTILGITGDWYNIKVTYNKKTYTGYASKMYITIKEDNSSNTDNNNSNNTDNNNSNNTDNNNNDSGDTTDQAFEVLLQNFPESYKASLRAMHVEYPNWRFVAVNTGLDWNTVIANESIVGRNVIQSNYPRGTATLAPFSYLSTEAGAYDWAKDKYVVKDGSNWYSANSQVIAHYMDPRNFLNTTDIFQFEALAYDESQSISVVQSILSNTFMSGDYSAYDSTTKQTVTGSYKDAFMDAGKSAKANPYFLATRAKQEVGVSVSNATSGTYAGYEGIYNFYNIGAFDGTNAVAKGLQWAKGGASGSTTYGRPWTTPYKSIVGGAQYIAQNYINQGQNTLYFQKFNVKPNNPSDLYLHQYMTNVQAPYSEGRITRTAYNTMGILGDSMVFYIPVYYNMPETACALPAVSGNPNPYLSSVKLYNGETEIAGMTPTFAYNQFEYTIAVPMAVTSITLKASTVSKYATVTGTGTYNLQEPGIPTTIQLIGQAQNGAAQVYTINITRNTQ
ncbi:MAG: SH3 domain-containing protein [Lachnospiraceae bacterium]|nr:SH3 domain-containing protein [Lachnospiraceae bacterium]